MCVVDYDRDETMVRVEQDYIHIEKISKPYYYHVFLNDQWLEGCQEANQRQGWATVIDKETKQERKVTGDIKIYASKKALEGKDDFLKERHLEVSLTYKGITITAGYVAHFEINAKQAFDELMRRIMISEDSNYCPIKNPNGQVVAVLAYVNYGPTKVASS